MRALTCPPHAGVGGGNAGAQFYSVWRKCHQGGEHSGQGYEYFQRVESVLWGIWSQVRRIILCRKGRHETH